MTTGREGSKGSGVRPSEALSGKQLLEMYRWMLLTRAYEEKAQELWSTGLVVESLHGSQGQEAIGVGVCAALRKDDVILPSLRTRAAFFVRGVPVKQFLSGMLGKATGAAHGKATAHHMGYKDGGILIGSALVGSSIPVSTGAALAFRMRGEDRVSVSFFGDGATERGDFHEALNIAGVWKLPAIYVIENNLYAEFTPIAKHFAGKSLAARADGYGFPGVTVDGNDILAVFDATYEATERARAGEGATLIECMTYRQRGHSSSHPPTEGRDPAEVEEWLKRDPIVRFKAELEKRGLLGPGVLEGIETSVAREIDDAVQYAIDSPLPDPAELYRDVYATPDAASEGAR
jgi:acetoin:2,6-dichlorophenolindophenol oxidoreductase subunit alpha